jgi:acetyltransferase-like isoleucine patch superfamily enzyme
MLWFFPWGIRRRLLAKIFGFEIHPTARIGKSIILAKHLKMDAHSRIHNLVFCKAIDRLEMGEDSGIATLTYITGFSIKCANLFKGVPDRKCELVLGRSAGITSRHFVDCNGGVYIGEFTTVAGIRSQILTHSIDIYTNSQTAKPIRVGKYCFVGTGCILLPGSALPDYSVLGAGSVLAKAYDDVGWLYAGSPARPMKQLDVSNIPYFKRSKHVVD